MRRVLFVSYFFPPLGGAGVQRPTKFVKYLRGAGWEPTVITTRGRWYPVRDETLARDVPQGTRVIAARELAPARRLAALAAAVSPAAAAAIGWPDQMAGWIPAAVRAALAEVERERPDVLFTTSAPYSAHLVGLIVRRITGIPWVADFRDEWTTNPEHGEQPALAAALSTAAERRIVRAASRLVVTSDQARLAEEPPPGRMVTVTNGVDPDDLAGVEVAPPADRLRLSFVGTLYAGRDCAPVFAALRRLAERGAIDAARVEFRIVGNNWLPERPDAGPVRIEEVGYVDHARAVREMAAAGALVVYLPEASRAIPGKLFEYLASGRPVLSVAHPDNAGHALVRRLDGGYTLEPADAAGIEHALEELWRRWLDGSLQERALERRERALELFSREHLTRDLARVLEDAAAAG